MGDLRPNPWTNVFGKFSIFRLFYLLFLKPRKAFFFLLGYHKTRFPGLYFPPPKVEKSSILDQKDGLVTLE